MMVSKSLLFFCLMNVMEIDVAFRSFLSSKDLITLWCFRNTMLRTVRSLVFRSPDVFRYSQDLYAKNSAAMRRFAMMQRKGFVFPCSKRKRRTAGGSAFCCCSGGSWLCIPVKIFSKWVCIFRSVSSLGSGSSWSRKA